MGLDVLPAQAILLNLTAGGAPVGWPTGAVPVNVPDPSDAAPVIPAQLNHLTYFDWSVHQNPSLAGTWRDEFYIDGDLMQLVTRSGSSVSQAELQGDMEATSFPSGHDWVERNSGPIWIAGGRHTLEIRTDPDHTSGEDWDNWGDNVYRIPFVWIPTTITPLLSTVTVPPQGNFTAPAPNCNAYAYTRTPASAWVASMVQKLPDAESALLIYDDYVNSTTGLSHEIGRCARPGVLTNFVVASASGTAGTVYPSCSRMPGSPSVTVTMAVADAAGRQSATGSAVWPSVNMPYLMCAQVFEAHLTQGVAQTMTVTRFLGESDLELLVYPPSTTIASRIDATWISTARAGDDEYDDLVFTPPATGTYLLVVARVDASDVDHAAGYRLDLAPMGSVDAPVAFAEIALAAAPSPASGPMRLSFALARPERVALTIFDLGGRIVRRVIDESLPAGPHARSWDGADDRGRALPSGRYFARLTAGTRKETLGVLRIR